MDELYQAIEGLINDTAWKIVLSGPKAGEYRRINIRKTDDGFHVEKLTEKQAFHENITRDEAARYIADAMTESFKQLTAWDESFETSVRLSKKGKVLMTRIKTDASQPADNGGHNRQKKYILLEGEVIPPLVDMGIFTSEGRVVKSMSDKFRQINRFIELIDDEAGKLNLGRPLNIIDFGCGKSYLTFLLYYYFTQVKKQRVNMVGLDLKEDVIEKSRQAAEKYGYDELTFFHGDIKDYKTDSPVDIIISLHACDTATDYALYNAVKMGARLIFSVPCCQHELCGQIKSEYFLLLTKHGLVKERIAALMTDSIRANLLEYSGYRVQMLEFVELEHTPKNILIRAVKANVPREKRDKSLDEVRRVMKEFSLEPTLYELLL